MNTEQKLAYADYHLLRQEAQGRVYERQARLNNAAADLRRAAEGGSVKTLPALDYAAVRKNLDDAQAAEEKLADLRARINAAAVVEALPVL